MNLTTLRDADINEQDMADSVERPSQHHQGWHDAEICILSKSWVSYSPLQQCLPLILRILFFLGFQTLVLGGLIG